MVAATVLNGLGTYLKRVGLTERQRSAAYWVVHCGNAGTVPGPLGFGWRCLGPNTEGTPGDRYRRERPYARYVLEVGAMELPLKVAKDLVVIGLIGAGLIAALRSPSPWTILRRAWPVAALLCLVAAGAMTAAFQQGPSLVGAGLRSFSFLAVALAAVFLHLGGSLGRIAKAMTVLLIVQLALCVPEWIWGAPMHTPAMRLAGTLVLPNSLGAFALAALAFVAAFEEEASWRVRTFAAAPLLVVAAGSATGLLALLALMGALVLQRTNPRRRLIAAAILALMAALLLSVLPRVMSRPQLYDSLWSEQGRRAGIRQALSAPWPDVILGRGVGIGTNASVNLTPSARKGPPSIVGGSSLMSDSTMTLLLYQTGLVGALLFYAMMLVGWRRDPEARIFYALVSLASLTVNVAELFPVNVLLGLTLAHTFSAESPPFAPDRAGALPVAQTGGVTDAVP